MNGNIVYSREACIFLNEVKSIIRIIRQNNLKPDEVTILCSESQSSKLPKGFTIGGLDTDRNNPKTNLSLSARSHLLKVWIFTRIMQVPISSSMQGRSGRPLTSCWIYLRFLADRGLIQIHSVMMLRYITRPTLPL